MSVRMEAYGDGNMEEKGSVEVFDDGAVWRGRIENEDNMIRLMELR